MPRSGITMLYGYAWSCIVMYGYVWLCMVMYGYVNYKCYDKVFGSYCMDREKVICYQLEFGK